MKRIDLLLAPCILLTLAAPAIAQNKIASTPGRAAMGQFSLPQPADPDHSSLDANGERQALKILLDAVEKHIVSAAEAMPADKYGFVPGNGEFKGVRTFGQQLKHLAATNDILAAAALGQDPPPDAGDELGPETVRTKAEIVSYLNDSFARLDHALAAVGDNKVRVRSSPISPLPAAATTRLALVVEALVHAQDHYGQMVEYLRMNGVVPPASRP
jgi:uncharacterized damage-inducible protein DinB